eukprot:1705732-Prymnesium_polylepis.1
MLAMICDKRDGAAAALPHLLSCVEHATKGGVARQRAEAHENLACASSGSNLKHRTAGTLRSIARPVLWPQASHGPQALEGSMLSARCDHSRPGFALPPPPPTRPPYGRR